MSEAYQSWPVRFCLQHRSENPFKAGYVEISQFRGVSNLCKCTWFWLPPNLTIFLTFHPCRRSLHVAREPVCFHRFAARCCGFLWAPKRVPKRKGHKSREVVHPWKGCWLGRIQSYVKTWGKTMRQEPTSNWLARFCLLTVWWVWMFAGSLAHPKWSCISSWSVNVENMMMLWPGTQMTHTLEDTHKIEGLPPPKWGWFG